MLEYARAVHAFDPVELARSQLAEDRAKTARFPWLLDRKIQRMSASPLAFLRGAAPLFYQMLAARPELARGPGGDGWLTGDQHLENFGAYRPAGSGRHGKHASDGEMATFNLNDFDDAIVGPLRFDVLRLTTSLILGGRELGADGATVLDLSYGLLDAYVGNAFGKGRTPAAPRPVAALIGQVVNRSRDELLEGRTVVRNGKRRFVRGERYRDLPGSVTSKVPAAFARYLSTVDPSERPDERDIEIVDTALRIAGTGSLGSLRVAVLVRKKGDREGGWLFDMKEQGTPSAATLLGKPKLDPSTRVVTAARACLERPARMIGTTKLNGLSMFTRRLAPQEDKLDLSRIAHGDLSALATYLGALLGAAHRRGAGKKVPRAWSQAEREQVLDHAVTVAGVHEATYLALCKLTRR
jgi:uncharacterized protein (DUF2252 family)